jgi:NADPH-dependent curcumin reductase CurA
MVQNKGLIYKEAPTHWPELGKHIAVETREFDKDQAPPEGGITAKVHYVSFDPYQRGRMRKPEVKSYAPPFEQGKPVTNSAVVTVIKSANDNYKPGDTVVTMAYTEEYSVIPKEMLAMGRKLENPYNLDPKLFIGALGMPGLTAYSSFYAIGEPKKGETIFISAAAGAVGQIVGQLAKHEGLRVIGSVGDDKKLEFITKELNFDGGFNYKKEKASEALQRLAPDGVDIYYENVSGVRISYKPASCGANVRQVGGEQLEAAINAMNPFGRIVACGMISNYNKPPSEHYPIRNLIQVVAKRIKMQGFIVSPISQSRLVQNC